MVTLWRNIYYENHGLGKNLILTGWKLPIDSGHLVCIVALKDLTLPSPQQFLRFVLFTQEVNAVSIV